MSVCNVGMKIGNFHRIDTDIPIEHKQALISLLDKYSDYFVVGIPTGRVLGS